MKERVLPQSIEAEQAILGAMMLEKDAIAKVEELLRPEDFYCEAHKVVYTAILELAERNEPADIVTVMEYLRRDGKFDVVGGISTIAHLANSVQTAKNVVYHARIVEEKSLLRKLVNAATEVADMGYAVADDVDNILDTAKKKIMEVSKHNSGQYFLPIKEVVHDAFSQIEKLYENKDEVTGLATGSNDAVIRTGFKRFDKLTQGLQSGSLTLLAAAPGTGKTDFSLNIVEHIALTERKTVGYFSLKLPANVVVQKLLSIKSCLGMPNILSADLSDEGWTSLINSAEKLIGGHIFIDDTPELTVADIIAKTKKLKAEHGIDVVIIDYFQLIKMANGIGIRETIQGETVRLLKEMACELNIAMLLLYSLPSKRSGENPDFSDLSNFNLLDRYIDSVIFLYYYSEKSKEWVLEDGEWLLADILELTVAKQINGSFGKIHFQRCEGHLRFKELDRKKDDGYFVYELAYPMPCCKKNEKTYEKHRHIGYVQGVFEKDNRPFIAEFFYKDDNRDMRSVVFIMAAQDILVSDDGNKCRDGDKLPRGLEKSSLFIKGLKFIQQVRDRKKLDIVFDYLHKQGAIEPVTDMVNGICILLRDLAGNEIVAYAIKLDDKKGVVKCPLLFSKYRICE